jgi:SAM-dependent methyltransferase
MASQQTLLQASCDLLQSTARDTRTGSVLLIKHPLLPWPDAECVERNQQSFGRAVHLSKGTGPERYSGLVASSVELPFVEHSFQQVVLLHVLEHGQQAELAEASRVLAHSGELLVLGLNPWGWRSRRDAMAAGLPRLAVRNLARSLPGMGMKLQEIRGAGCLGRGNKVITQQGFGGLLLPFVDLQVLVAVHSHPATFTPLRLDHLEAGVAPYA